MPVREWEWTKYFIYPETRISCYTRQNFVIYSYSKENFEGNQLLDISIGLSPLYLNLKIKICT